MPLVPVVDQSAGSMPTVQAPSVAPMQDHSAEQTQRLGATLQQAGEQSMRVNQAIGLRIQEQMDDANVKAAETKFIQESTDILHGEKGYMLTRGADAINGYDAATQSIIKAKKELLDSLGNDVQKHIFQQVATQHLVTFGGQMGQHRTQQRVEYSAAQAASRADSMRSLAMNADIGSTDQNKYIETGISELANAYSEKGIPRDSDQFKEAERKYRSQIVQDNVSRMLEEGKYKEADTYLKSQTSPDKFSAVPNPQGMVEKGNLPIWNRPTVKNEDGSVSTEYSTSYEENGKEVLVPTVVNGKFLTPDGKKPAEGSAEEKAMFQAAWQHYKDTGENLGKFDSADNAEAYAQQLHNRGTGGGGIDADTADKLRGVIHSNSQRVENIETADKIFAPYKSKDLETADLEAMLQKVGEIKDPEQRQLVDSLVKARFTEQHSIQQMQYRDTLNDVVDYKYAHGGSLKGVDPMKWGLLNPKDKYELSKPPAVETDVDTLYNFVTKPDTLTVDNVKNAYSKGLLSKGSYISLTEEAMRMGSKAPFVQEAIGTSERIKFFATQAGIAEDDKQGYIDMNYRINNDIERVKGQQHGKITGEQVDKIINKELTQRILTAPRDPLSFARLWGSKTYTIDKRNFQIPEGTVGIGIGDDGEKHYVDAQHNDLGKVK